MNKREVLARVVVLLIVVGFPAAVLAHQYVYVPAMQREENIIDLVAHTPAEGGWSPEIITVNKGDTVRLRITATDVVHGFAIGQLGIDVGTIIPGEVTTVEFVANEVGRFTYYCNVWCSPHHPRMRGTLEVVDPEAPDTLVIPEDSVEFTQIDIDSPHEAEIYPAEPPNVAEGQEIARSTGLDARHGEDVRTQSPSAVFQAIRQQDGADHLSDDEVWDLVAYAWLGSVTPAEVETGRILYTKNCLACHGQSGEGDGPGSLSLEEQMPDFTDPVSMAGATSEILYAKMRRGGMGTGMPYWGPIFTEEQTWNVVDYLWTFFFNWTEPA
jgi:cytochrome c oxidase subunit 2